ncbi:MAG: hypothetical protein HC898_01415 [Phycisphaerales bacterium]|nr:hypothetical protein [Phycisphaerales bacterium]
MLPLVGSPRATVNAQGQPALAGRRELGGRLAGLTLSQQVITWRSGHFWKR